MNSTENPTPPHPRVALKCFAVVDMGVNPRTQHFLKRFRSQTFGTDAQAQAFVATLPAEVKDCTMVIPVFQ
jgi:hypothetical protein